MWSRTLFRSLPNFRRAAAEVVSSAREGMFPEKLCQANSGSTQYEAMNKLTFWLRKPLTLVALACVWAITIGAVLPVTTAVASTVPLANARSVAAEAPPVPAPRLSSLDLCLGVDDSGSEYGADGTDPTGLRYTASRSAVQWLEGVKVSDIPNRVAVAHFGSTAPSALASPLSAVTAESLPRIVTALTAPEAHLGATNIGAVIERCQELLGSPTSGRTQAILIFTDGAPDLGNGPTPALFADIDAQIRKRTDVPVTVIRQDAHQAEAEGITAAWNGTALKMLTTLPAGDLEQNLSRALVDALSQQIGVLPAASRLDTNSNKTTVRVADYAPSMGITLFSPASNAKLEVQDPAGNVAHVLEGRVNFWSQQHPEAGDWTLHLLEGDSVDVQTDVVPLQVDVVSPSTDIPTGRPLQVTLRLGGQDKIEPQARAPLFVGASVSTGTGTFVLEFSQGPDGLWRSTEAVPIASAGTIGIRTLVKAGSTTVLDTTESTVSAISRPYLTLENATATSGEDLRFALYQEGKPISNDVLGQDPRAAVVMQPGSAENYTTSNPQRLEFDGTRWLLPATPEVNGQPISLLLSTQLPDGTLVRDTLTHIPVVNDPDIVVRGENIARSLSVTAGALTLAAGCWFLWLVFSTRSRLRGSLVVAGPGITPARRIRVEGRRWYRSPSARPGQRQLIWFHNGRLWTRKGVLPWPLDSRELGRDEAYLASRHGGQESSLI